MGPDDTYASVNSTDFGSSNGLPPVRHQTMTLSLS